MKKLLLFLGALVLCGISGAVGASLALLYRSHDMLTTRAQNAARDVATTTAHETANGDEVLQVHRLELLDAKHNTRAVFAVDNDGNVILRMLSEENTPIVEISANKSIDSTNKANSIGKLTIRDDRETPVVTLGTYRRGAGALLFSSSNVHGMVSVGYQDAGDYVDGSDSGLWGIQVKGADHAITAMGVRTDHGVPQEIIAPLGTQPRK